MSAEAEVCAVVVEVVVGLFNFCLGKVTVVEL